MLNKILIEEAISQIEKIALENVSIIELVKILNPLFTGLKVNVPIYKPDEVNIFRGRICEKPKYLFEISYPPSKYINTYGRVNDIRQPMFYGSIGKGAPITELNVKVGDTLVMGLWNVKDELVLNHIGFTFQTASSLNSKRPLQSKNVHF